MSSVMRGLVAALSLFLITSLITSLSRAADATSAPSSAPSGKSLTLKVTDGKTHAPLAGVVLKLEAAGTGKDAKDQQTTDAAGSATLSLPASGAAYVYTTARKDTYVPKRLMWRRNQGKDPTIPATYDLTMEPGTTLRGTVVDETDKPVAGATVSLAVRNKKERDAVESNDVSYVSTKCDENGKWTYSQAPALIDQIDVGAWQHDCDITQGFYNMGEIEKIESLRDGTAKLKLERGVKVDGVVFGSDGKPLAKATIGVGGDRVASNIIPAVKTDDSGHFAFGAKPGAQVVMTVKASKHAPELREFTMGDKPEHVEIHLQPGKVMEGRVVDAAGKPLQGVTLYTDTWRGHRTIDTHLTTDKDGHFIWKSAPNDAVMMDIMKMGFADLRHHALVASTQPITVTLQKPLRVTGAVVDADTGKPVEAYNVIQGISFGNGQPTSWQRRGNGDEPVKPRPGGTFEFEQSYPYPGYAIRIEADGYEPADSRIYKLEEGKVDLQFKLHKGKPFAGVVAMSDGKPAAGAELLLATKGTQVRIENGRPSKYGQDSIHATTDAEGKFKLPSINEPFILVVLHDAGQTRVNNEQWAAANGQIKLEPWAKIDGVVRVGSKPGKDEDISLWAQEPFEENAPRVFREDKVKANESGRFSFDRVFPGKVGISRYIALGPAMWGGAINKSAVAEAGKTVHVDIGGTGRPVTGRVEFPADMPARWLVQGAAISSKMDMEKPPLPDNWEDMEQEQKKTWYENWQKSDAGKAFAAKAGAREATRKTYSFPVAADGTFRAEDVEPGTYIVNISIAQPPVGSTCGWGEAIGSASTEFTVADMPGGRSDEAMQLPSMPFKVNKTVKVGDAAPDFAVKTIDGKDLKLADYKGKYVLLDFWATWCGPCVAETPALKSAYDAFAADPHFAMISLSLDDKPSAPQKFAAKQGIKWTQGFLGDWSKATLPNDYGVHGIPSIWLIGPDGKVLAKDLRGESIKQTIGQFLPPAQTGG